MELYLQIGWGMMEHCRQLIRAWGNGTVILSPRDLSPNQLVSLGSDIRKLGGSVLLDPQFYLPHADHERLLSHSYWPNDYESMGFWAGSGLERLLKPLFETNQQVGCADVILPGVLAPTVDNDWIARQDEIAKEGFKLNADRFGLLTTVALGEEAVRDSRQIDAVLDAAERWAVQGVYLVCEHPHGEYLVSDPIWASNVLDITAGLRLQGKQVIIGYSHHQMLMVASAGATAIASGTWMNVRSFPPEKFRAQYEEELKKRATWYYCPQALSEFKIPFLDVAHQQGVLDLMAPEAKYGSQYANALFSGPKPTSVGFDEPDAFRHYLQCLHTQVGQAKHTSFDATVDAHGRILDEAERILDRLHSVGVRGQLRDFGETVDVNRAALGLLRTGHGSMLRHQWKSL